MSAVPLQARSFIAWAGAAAPGGMDLTGSGVVVWSSGGLHVGCVPRNPVMSPSGSGAVPERIVLGDVADLDSSFSRPGAGGVAIRVEPQSGTVRISTSIVGLPPIFIYRGQGVTAITSDIHLLLTVPGIDLSLDPRSVAELGHIGHPVEHRTLFRNVELAQSGAEIEMDASGRISIRGEWELPRSPALAWDEFLERQIEAFSRALSRTDLTASVLSLTAGLDTRTVFSTLAAQQRLVPATTMSGPGLSLDAMVARRLCHAYGVEHFLVTFAEDFTSRLPEHAETASLLSGGLASVDQAPEVYLYDQLGPRFRARLSGNLGNQVGRGGTEGVSVRGARLEILGSRIRSSYSNGAGGREHWLLRHLDEGHRARLQFILQQETLFTLAGNYSIGNHFAVQQTPYASRELIETLAQRPPEGASNPSGSRIRMRLRDLEHRFLGEPEERSFQRRLVRRSDGAAAQVPVNWGWRPSGGMSVPGLVRGVATLGGMYARAKGLDGRGAALNRLAELHDFRNSRRWLRDVLRDYTFDQLTTQRVRESGLFDTAALHSLLDEHFVRGRDHYHSVVFALDIALADRLFCRAG